MKPVILHDEAQAELDAAAAHYDAQRAGLGRQLIEEVATALGKIGSDPGIGARYRNGEFRFYRLDRFPYVLYYLELTDAVWIAAVAHSRRKPNYWRRRAP